MKAFNFAEQNIAYLLSSQTTPSPALTRNAHIIATRTKTAEKRRGAVVTPQLYLIIDTGMCKFGSKQRSGSDPNIDDL